MEPAAARLASARLCGLQHRLVHLLAGHVWAGEHVEHGRDVNADVALKGHDFFHADFNVPVHVGLKGARIGHDRAGVIQQVMHAVLKRMLAQFLVLPDDVTVRDEHLDAVGVPHLTWFDGSEVRIDDRQQRWGGDHPMRRGQRPHACSSVACLDLKTAHVILARGFRVVPRMLAPRRHGRPTAPCPSKVPSSRKPSRAARRRCAVFSTAPKWPLMVALETPISVATSASVHFLGVRSSPTSTPSRRHASDARSVRQNRCLPAR